MRTRALLLAMLLSLPGLGAAQDRDAALGRWLAYEASDGSTTLVELYRVGDTLEGRVLSMTDAQRQPLLRHCTRCPGTLRGEPLVGMRFLWGLRQQDGQWLGGEVMDLREGLTQGLRAEAEIRVEGDHLRLRAFRGLRALGQTRVWRRAP